MSTTKVWSSNEHHSLSILTDRSRGHSAGAVYHPIDEFHRQICPTAIGGGRALFPNRQSYLRFQLVDVRIYDTGVVYLQYEPKRDA